MSRELKLLLLVIVTSVILLDSSAVTAEQISEDSVAVLLTNLSEFDFAQPLGKAVSPDWPADAPDSVFKAMILMRVKVDHNGSVDSVESIYCSAPHLCFEDEAMSAARKTTFARSDSAGIDFPDWQYYAYEFWSPEYPRKDEFVPVEQEAERIYFGIPVYPRLAEQTRRTGTVWVKVLVGKTGRVVDVAVYKTSGHKDLDRAGVVAAFDCKFKPAMKDGKPISMWVAWPYRFEL